MYYIEVLKRKNSRKYSPIKEFETAEEVSTYIGLVGDKYASTPYFFTHINLTSGAIITQKINGIVCSPTKLRDLLIS